jgi:hypothetical protein
MRSAPGRWGTNRASSSYLNSKSILFEAANYGDTPSGLQIVAAFCNAPLI